MLVGLPRICDLLLSDDVKADKAGALTMLPFAAAAEFLTYQSLPDLPPVAV